MASRYPDDLISNWSTLIENLEASPLNFFESVESAIKKRAIPEIELSRVDFRESGIFSAKREYLRVIRGKFTFDICSAPYGTGFFVSWWLGSPKRSILLSIPIIRTIYKAFIKPATYYSLDTAAMFQTATHAAVLDAVDGLVSARGLRALSEFERRPVMHEFSSR